jgi:uncharacterized protein YjbI with pentapeptide repeats
MGKAIHPALGRLKNVRACLQGRFDRDFRALLVTIVEAQGGAVADDLDAKITHVVTPAGAPASSLQKKVDALNKKGASVALVDEDAFLAHVRPTSDELTALIHDGKRGRKALAVVAPVYENRREYHGAARGSPMLSGVKFDGADLSDLGLEGVAVSQCSFVGCKLDGTRFSEAVDCDFSKSAGDSPVFGKVDLSRFREVHFRKPKFCSHLNGADFTSARIDDGLFDEHFRGSAVFDRPSDKGACFRRAELRGSLFDDGDLKGADFTEADLTGVAFNDGMLDGACFRNAKADGALFVANYLRKADLTGCSFVGANLAEADLTDARLDDADFSGANLRGATAKPAAWKTAKEANPPAAKSAAPGPALKEVEAILPKSYSIKISFRVGDDTTAGGFDVGMTAYANFTSFNIYERLSPKAMGTASFSKKMMQAAAVFGHLPVRYETLKVEGKNCPVAGKPLRELVMRSIAEAFDQQPPDAADPAAAAAFKKKQKELQAAARKQREAAAAQAAKAKAAEKKEVAKKIKKAVGKVNDTATFLKALELRIEKAKIDKATAMLKASGFKLFNDVSEFNVSGVVKSQTDPDLVYACRIEDNGHYACCTQNLNICGGLRGSVCKHLLVLIIGLVQAGEVDPETIDEWIFRTHGVKPELDKEAMGAIFLKYKGAEAGEVDWRPTETVPEDYYAL